MGMKWWIPWKRKCSIINNGISGSHSSMWNKKRCKIYSRKVQMMLPVKKQASTLTIAWAGTSVHEDMGNAGFEVKAGRIKPENWNRERKKI